MKLYCMSGACSLASHIALEWIGAPYEVQTMSREDIKSDAYLKLNPAGAVPVLDVDGWVLTQNAAIFNYLADRFPESGLGGDGTPKSRADVNRWLAFINSDMHPAFKPLFGSTGYLKNAGAIDKTRNDARHKLRGYFERLNAQLEGRDFIAGSRSIADPYLFVVLRWAKSLNIDLHGLANLDAFLARMNADPSVSKVLADEGSS